MVTDDRMHVITLTGFKASEREALARAISNLDNAKHLPDLTHASNATLKFGFTSILCCKSIVASSGSEKFVRAIEWGVPVVTWRWIEQSIRLKSVQPLDAFKTDMTGPELSTFLSKFPPPTENKGKENHDNNASVLKDSMHLLVKEPLIEAKDRLNTPLGQSRSLASSIHIPSQLSLNQMAPDPQNKSPGPNMTHQSASDFDFSFRPHLNSQQDPRQLNFNTSENAKDPDSMDISPETAGFKSRKASPMLIDARRCFSFSPLPPGLEISMTPAGECENKAKAAPHSVFVEHNMLIPETQCEEASSMDSPKSLISYLKTRQMHRGLNEGGQTEGNTSARLLYSWSAVDENKKSRPAPLEAAPCSNPSHPPSPSIDTNVIESSPPSPLPPPPQPAIQPQYGRLSEFIGPGLSLSTFIHTPLHDTEDPFSSPPPDSSYDYQHELELGMNQRGQPHENETAVEIEATEEEEEEKLVHDLEDELEDEGLNAPSQSKPTPLRRLKRGSLCPLSSISKPQEVVVVKEGGGGGGGGGAAARAIQAARAARMSASSLPRSEAIPAKQEDTSSDDGGGVMILKSLSRPPKQTTAKGNPYVCNKGLLKGLEFADEISFNGRTVTCRDKAKKITCPKIALPPPCPLSYVHSDVASSSSAQLYPIEPYAIYRRTDGEWWVEFHRLLSFQDALGMIHSDNPPQSTSWLPCLASDFDPTREVFKAVQREHAKLANLRAGDVTVHRIKKISHQAKGKDCGVLLQRFGWDMEEKKVLVEVQGSDLVID